MRFIKIIAVVTIFVTSCTISPSNSLKLETTDLLQGIYITYEEMHENVPVVEIDGSTTTKTYTGIGVVLIETENPSDNLIRKHLSFSNCLIQGKVTGEFTIEINTDSKLMTFDGDFVIDEYIIQHLVIDAQCIDCNDIGNTIDGEITTNDEIYSAKEFKGCFGYY